MGWRTMILTATTCFLAGTSYTHWIVDHDTLWRSPTPPHAIENSLAYYGILSGGSSRLGWFWAAVCLTAIVSVGGRCAAGLVQLRSEDGGGGTGGFLFDAACTLLLIRVLVSATQSFQPAMASVGNHVANEEEVVRELADTNLVISVALTGVILLQAGRYYSERVSSKSARRLLASSRETTPGAEDSSARPRDGEVPRPGTPYRELTQDEAMELESDLDLNDGEVVTSVKTRRA